MTAPLDLNALLAALQPCGDCYHEDSALCRPPRCECPCHGRHTLACRALPRAVAELTETLARVTAERDALRAALVALVTAEIACGAAALALAVTGRSEEIDRIGRLLDEATERALETLARTRGV